MCRNSLVKHTKCSSQKTCTLWYVSLWRNPAHCDRISYYIAIFITICSDERQTTAKSHWYWYVLLRTCVSLEGKELYAALHLITCSQLSSFLPITFYIRYLKISNFSWCLFDFHPLELSSSSTFFFFLNISFHVRLMSEAVWALDFRSIFSHLRIHLMRPCPVW